MADNFICLSSGDEGSVEHAPVTKILQGMQGANAAGLHNVSDSCSDDSEDLLPLTERLKRKLSDGGLKGDNFLENLVQPRKSPRDEANCLNSFLENKEMEELPNLFDGGDFDSNHDYEKPSSTGKVDKWLQDLTKDDNREACKTYEADKAQQKVNKEKEKEEKRKKRETVKAEKEEKKLAERRQREAAMKEKQAFRQQLNSMKPGECLKYVTALIDPELLELDGSGDILSMLQALEVQYKIEPQTAGRSVQWQRKVVQHSLDSDSLELMEESSNVIEQEVLINIPLGDFIDLVHSYAYPVQDENGSGHGLESLRNFSKRIKGKLNNRNITFIVMGIDMYFRHIKTLQQRQYRANVLGTTSKAQTKSKKRDKLADITTIVSRVDIEEALVDLQICAGIGVRLVENIGDIADLVAVFTKAVAETPFKRDRNELAFAFAAEADTKGGHRVQADGRGLLNVWRSQLQQFNNISADIAMAITSSYPSPTSLLQAYKNCNTESEAKNLLADIVVRRHAGVLFSTRKVGKEFSRRMHEFFTSNNKNHLLN